MGEIPISPVPCSPTYRGSTVLSIIRITPIIHNTLSFNNVFNSQGSSTPTFLM